MLPPVLLGGETLCPNQVSRADLILLLSGQAIGFGELTIRQTSRGSLFRSVLNVGCFKSNTKGTPRLSRSPVAYHGCMQAGELVEGKCGSGGKQFRAKGPRGHVEIDYTRVKVDGKQVSGMWACKVVQRADDRQTIGDLCDLL